MDTDLIKPTLVLGLLQAGLYGLLPISIVLCYRVSRTIAFVHGGIAVCGGLAYRVLMSGFKVPYTDWVLPVMGPREALLTVLLAGAAMGGAYGAVVMSRRLARLPAMTLTVLSLGVMILITAYAPRYIRSGGGGSDAAAAALGVSDASRVALGGAGAIAQSPFGGGGAQVWGQFVPTHRSATLLIVVGLVVVLALILNYTYTGLAMRAIADDFEASVWCGTRLRLIAAGVYAVAGAVAALAGALMVATVASAGEGMLMLFMRGLIIAVVGGLRSIPLALAGALLFGLLETALRVGLFGDRSGGEREIVLVLAMTALILLFARKRRENFFLLGRTS